MVPLREIWLRGEDDRPDDGLDDLTANDESADLAAVHADDQLVSAMADPDLWLALHAGDGPDLEDRLFEMLAAWRSDIQTEPTRPLVTVEQAMAALAAGKPAAAWHKRFIPLAGAAAALVVAISGVAVGAKDAVPGDALWGVSKVLYTERAQSVEAAAQVKGSLAKAQSALASGRTGDAVRALAQAQTGLPAVRAQEGRDALVAQQQILAAKAADAEPTSALPDPTVPDPSTAQLPPMLVPALDPANLPKPPAPKPALPPDRSATQAAPKADPAATAAPTTDPPATGSSATDPPAFQPSPQDNSGDGSGNGHQSAEGSPGTGGSSGGSDTTAQPSDQTPGGDGTSSGGQPIARADPPAPPAPPQAGHGNGTGNGGGGAVGDLLSAVTGAVADVGRVLGAS